MDCLILTLSPVLDPPEVVPHQGGPARISILVTVLEALEAQSRSGNDRILEAADVPHTAVQAPSPAAAPLGWPRRRGRRVDEVMQARASRPRGRPRPGDRWWAYPRRVTGTADKLLGAGTRTRAMAVGEDLFGDKDKARAAGQSKRECCVEIVTPEIKNTVRLAGAALPTSSALH